MVHYCSSGIRKKLHRMMSVVAKRRGDDMKIGFIGAGKAGCSLGKYFSIKKDLADIEITGYQSLEKQEAQWAAEFTNSTVFDTADEVIRQSDTIIISTLDGAVKDVWDFINKDNIKGKMFCHLSGSLSSDVFSRIEEYGAYKISIHPMFAFSNKDSAYLQLNQISFTLEGDEYSVSVWKDIFSKLGNATVSISKEVKPKYHAAASILSNHVIAVLETGYELLAECGFSKEEARTFSEILVKDNISNVIKLGSMDALTGPVERGDVDTVCKHFAVLDESKKQLYQSCAKKLLQISKAKNPKRDYQKMEEILLEK